MKAVTIFLFAVTGAVMLWYWQLGPDKATDSESAAVSSMSARGLAAPIVVVEPAQYAKIEDTIESIGTIRANESITLTSKLTETVSQVHFEDGDFVDAGKILVEMTNREESALLAEAQSNLDDARRQLSRQQDLDARGLTPKSMIDEAIARVESAGARLDAITARMNDRLIRAPFSGLLGFRDISPGTLLTPNTAITTLDDISVVKLDFSIPEIFLNAVNPGFSIHATSDAWKDKLFEGTINSIGSRIDPVTRAATVRAIIDNKDRLLRPGMLMTVKIITPTRRSLVIPESAFIQSGENTYVFLAGADGLAHQKTIRIGTRRRGYVEVVDGLKEGDPVITEGGFKLKDNSPFRTRANQVSPAGLPVQSSSAYSPGRNNVVI